jgi:hypothetical protein
MKKLGRVLLYIVPVLLVVHITATLITGHMVRRELDRIRAAGQALTVSELAPRVPPGEKNAADVYQRAFEAPRLSNDDNETLFGPAGTTDDEQRPPGWMSHARRVVSANRGYFALLEEASRIPACAFPVNWDNPLEAIFPHFASMREAARMLALRAEVLADDGDLDEAIASCATALRMAEHAKLEPTLIGQLVAYAIQGIEIASLERVLSKGTPSAEAARRLFDQVAATDQMTPLVRAMEWERTQGIWVFEFARSAPLHEVAAIMKQGMHDVPATHWEVASAALYRTVGRPLLNLDEHSFLHASGKHNQAIALPWPQSREQTETIQARVDRLPVYRSLVTKMIFPVFSRVVWSRDMKTAHLRAAQTALAAKAYRAEDGRYPDSLAELEAAGWDLPPDPFGGEPYRYRREGEGFVVWSIGPDMDDDHAERDWEAFMQLPPEEREKRPYDYDVIFRCRK